MLAFLSRTSPPRGDRPGFLCTNREDCEVNQSINCITVYRNEFFSAFGAGYPVELATFSQYIKHYRERWKFSSLCSSPNTLFILLQKLF